MADSLDIREKSMSLDDFNRLAPNMELIAQAIMDYEKFDDKVDPGELVIALQQVSKEAKLSAEGKVPEINRLQDELALQKKKNEKLLSTNLELNLRINNPPNPAAVVDDAPPPKKSFADIKAILDNL